jgi:hypothetical protein
LPKIFSKGEGLLIKKGSIIMVTSNFNPNSIPPQKELHRLECLPENNQEEANQCLVVRDNSGAQGKFDESDELGVAKYEGNVWNDKIDSFSTDPKDINAFLRGSVFREIHKGASLTGLVRFKSLLSEIGSEYYNPNTESLKIELGNLRTYLSSGQFTPNRNTLFQTLLKRYENFFNGIGDKIFNRFSEGSKLNPWSTEGIQESLYESMIVSMFYAVSHGLGQSLLGHKLPPLPSSAFHRQTSKDIIQESVETIQEFSKFLNFDPKEDYLKLGEMGLEALTKQLGEEDFAHARTSLKSLSRLEELTGMKLADSKSLLEKYYKEAEANAEKAGQDGKFEEAKIYFPMMEFCSTELKTPEEKKKDNDKTAKTKSKDWVEELLRGYFINSTEETSSKIAEISKAAAKKEGIQILNGILADAEAITAARKSGDETEERWLRRSLAGPLNANQERIQQSPFIASNDVTKKMERIYLGMARLVKNVKLVGETPQEIHLKLEALAKQEPTLKEILNQNGFSPLTIESNYGYFNPYAG